MLHQGGFERVCVATARLLEPFYEVYIVIFSSRDIAYDIRGLRVIDLHMGAEDGKLRKIRNVFRRSRKVSSMKRNWVSILRTALGLRPIWSMCFPGHQEKHGAGYAAIWTWGIPGC